MAFVFREEKLKKSRPNTALGPGQYLPITNTKIVKSNAGRAPFESSVKKFKPPYGELSLIKNATPGPGKYYNDYTQNKTKLLQNISNIKYANQEENLVQDKYLSKTGNSQKTKYNINKSKEKLGFDIKEKRFRNPENSNPGPGNYFKNTKTKVRSKSAVPITKSSFTSKTYKISVPSIPYNDNGFEIDENNSLVKLGDPNKFLMFRGDEKESVGPGSYDLDDPRSWIKSGAAWSKMKVPRLNYENKEKNCISASRFSTRPQTALESSMKIVSAKKKNMNRAQTTKMLNDTRHQRRENMSKLREDFENETRQRRKNGSKVPLLATDYYSEMEKFSNNQNPGPGYYIDMEKESEFYAKSMPFPEFKQFFLSNNERFPELKTNEFLGPATYFKDGK